MNKYILHRHKDGIHSEELQCDVLRLQYDFQRQTGHLVMESGDCTDMEGAIALFKRIDPDVQQIETFAGVDANGILVRDIVYRREGTEWFAADFSRACT